MEGYIANLSMPSHTHSLNMSYLRLGVGINRMLINLYRRKNQEKHPANRNIREK